MTFYSDPPHAIDRFVAEVLHYSKKGFFVDIGSHHYSYISNTYFLEKDLEWRGLAVELDEKYRDDFIKNRPNTTLINGDATILDYQKILDEMGAPKVIDFLSVDIEPPCNTLKALLKILETNYEYKIIVFETDYYRGDLTPRDVSRKVLNERGYKRIEDLENEQDDYWLNYNYIPNKVNSYFANNTVVIEHIK